MFAVQTWYGVKQDLPPAERTVKVIGQQWAWTFVHPGPDEKIVGNHLIMNIDISQPFEYERAAVPEDAVIYDRELRSTR